VVNQAGLAALPQHIAVSLRLTYRLIFLSRGYASEIFRGIASKKRMSSSTQKARGFPHYAAAEPPLDKGTYCQLASVLHECSLQIQYVEARLSRVDESEEREGFDEDSVERERPPKLVRESSVTNELVAVAKSAGLSLK